MGKNKSLTIALLLVCVLILSSYTQKTTTNSDGVSNLKDFSSIKSSLAITENHKTIANEIISENPKLLASIENCLVNAPGELSALEFLATISKWLEYVDKRCSWGLPINSNARFFDDELSVTVLTKVMACVWIAEVTMKDGQDYPYGGFTGDKDELLEFKTKSIPDQVYLNSMRVQNINIKGLVGNWGVDFNTYPESTTHFSLEESIAAGCMFMANCLNSIKKNWAFTDSKFNLRDMAGALWIWNPEPDCNESGGYWNMIMWQAFGDHFHTKYDAVGKKIPNDYYTFWSKNTKNQAYTRYITYDKPDIDAIKYWMGVQSEASNMKPGN
jgi:hypothetical protein